MEYFIAFFYILHGLVHLLYMGHSLRYFELEKGFAWPDNSGLLKKPFPIQTTRKVVAIWCILAGLGFVLSGICVLTACSWHIPLTLASVATSTLLFVVFWDGRFIKLHTQGGIAILINLLILVYTVVA